MIAEAINSTLRIRGKGWTWLDAGFESRLFSVRTWAASKRRTVFFGQGITMSFYAI